MIAVAYKWHRLLWVAGARGMLFIHAGKRELCVKQYEQGGWIVLFDELFYRTFLEHYPNYTDCTLFDAATSIAFIPLDEEQTLELDYHGLVLVDMLGLGKGIRYLQHILDFILMTACDSYVDHETGVLDSYEARQIRELHALVELNYKTERKTTFYARRLMTTPRDLNRMVMAVRGVKLFNLILIRLMAEADALLLKRGNSVKAIALELGFGSSGHFTTYYKRYKKMTPGGFRKLVWMR